MTIRFTLQMQDENQTFSETYWSNTGTDPSDPQAQSTADSLAKARALLLGTGASLFNCRIGATTTPRSVFNKRYNPPLSGNWLTPSPGGSWAAEFGNAALLVAHQSTGGKETRAYMAGMPAVIFGDQTGDTTGLNIPPAWTLNWGLWVAELSSGSFAFRYKYNPQSMPVQGLTTAAQYPSLCGVVLANALPVAGVGDRLQLQGFKRTNPSSKDLNGIWQVAGILQAAAPVNTVTYFLMDSQAVDTNNFWKLGTAATIGYNYATINNVQYLRAGSRKRGESIGLRRGRSKTKASHG
jgi:hypothetical protein